MRFRKYSKEFKERVIKLRKTGMSYSEIASEVPISKSTLSLWLRNIKLTEVHRLRLKKRIGISQPMAAKAHRIIRIERTKAIITSAKREIGRISKKELFYLGTALYWAEGSKQKEGNIGQRVTFNNSDPMMVKVYLEWLHKCVDVKPEELDFEIYSHNIRDKEDRVIKFWSGVTGYPKNRFKKIYYKRDKKRKYRRNQGENYYGLLRVTVFKSTDLNRKITGWVEGITDQYK